MRVGSGLFVVVEGIDGTGKTTLCNRLAEGLTKFCGSKVVQTAEPYEGPMGLSSVIRKVLQDDRRAGLSSVEMASLFENGRHFHLHDVIIPALNEGKVVVCDRFTLSTVAYQGKDIEERTRLVEVFGKMPIKPDMTIVLTADPWEVVERLPADPDAYERDLTTQCFANWIYKDHYICGLLSKSYTHISALNPTDDIVSESLFLLKPMIARARCRPAS